MRWSLCLKLICLICLVALPVSAGPQAHAPRPASSYYGGGHSNIRVYTGGYSGGIRFHTFGSDLPMETDPCFPYCSGGIGPEVTNSKPRTEDEKPACYYGADDVLFFEKEGSNCLYIRAASPNAARIEKRRQEHLAREPKPKATTKVARGDKS